MSGRRTHVKTASAVSDPPQEPLVELLLRVGYASEDPVMLATEAGGRFAPRACGSAQEAVEVIRSRPEGNWWVTTNRMRPVRKGRGSASDVIEVMALTVDIDFKPGGMGSEEQSRKLIDRLSQVLGTRPCAVVRTGGGLQPYWPLTGGEDIESAAALLKRWRILVEREASALDGTVDNTFDLPRVLRAPGSLNHKYEPPREVVTEFEETDDWRPVSIHEAHDRLLEAAVPVVAPVQMRAEVIAPERDWRSSSGGCAYVAAMLSGWQQEEPPDVGGRHAWMLAQATRLAAARRLGCLSDGDLGDALETLTDVMVTWVTSTGDSQRAGGMATEVAAAYRWAVQKVETKTDQECRLELGDHDHDEDSLLPETIKAARPTLSGAGPRPAVRPYSEIEPEKIDWMWEGRLPLGKVTMIDGDPGTGKSTLTIELAAHVSTGCSWPDGTPCPQGQTILLTAEDDPADTVRPRLDAAGADSEQVLELRGSIASGGDGGEDVIAFDLSHVDVLRAACEQYGNVKLIIVDVFMAYLPGRVDSHRDQDIRRIMTPLAELARETGAAIVLLRHLNKSSGGNPLYRGGGSIGISGAARTAYVVVRDDRDDLVLASTKNNVSQHKDSLKFRLVDAPEHGCARVEWLGSTDATAAELLSSQDAGKAGHGNDLTEYVKELVLDNGGLMNANEAIVNVEAEFGKVSKSSLNRAKAKAGIRSVKNGFHGSWSWVIEGSQGSEGSAD